MNASPDPAEFQHPREVRDELVNLFPSPNSLKWYLRQNRRELADCGALIVVGERLLLHPGLFRAFVIRAGMARAGAELEVA